MKNKSEISRRDLLKGMSLVGICGLDTNTDKSTLIRVEYYPRHLHEWCMYVPDLELAFGRFHDLIPVSKMTSEYRTFFEVIRKKDEGDINFQNLINKSKKFSLGTETYYLSEPNIRALADLISRADEFERLIKGFHF